jgi:hypothetical protein
LILRYLYFKKLPCLVAFSNKISWIPHNFFLNMYQHVILTIMHITHVLQISLRSPFLSPILKWKMYRQLNRKYAFTLSFIFMYCIYMDLQVLTKQAMLTLMIVHQAKHKFRLHCCGTSRARNHKKLHIHLISL